jgi:hypothetical protein
MRRFLRETLPGWHHAWPVRGFCLYGPIKHDQGINAIAFADRHFLAELGVAGIAVGQQSKPFQGGSDGLCDAAGKAHTNEVMAQVGVSCQTVNLGAGVVHFIQGDRQRIDGLPEIADIACPFLVWPRRPKISVQKVRRNVVIVVAGMSGQCKT